VRGELSQRVKKNTVNAMGRAAELWLFRHDREFIGFRVLPLKGPVLALQAYGSLELRHVGDLDLLIDPATVREADRILKNASYVRTSPDYPLSSGQAAAFMKIRKDFSYVRPGTSIHVELHWRWSQNLHLLPISFGEVWSRREFVEFACARIESCRVWCTSQPRPCCKRNTTGADNTPVSWMPAQARYRLKLRANLRYKLHNLYFHSLWTEECRRIRLPEWLFPLYFLFALFSWSSSLLRRPRGGGKSTTERDTSFGGGRLDQIDGRVRGLVAGTLPVLLSKVVARTYDCAGSGSWPSKAVPSLL